MSDQMLKETCLPAELLPKMQAGIMSGSYRGRSTWKCPMDIAIYIDILWTLKPATIVEFGSNRGGSAQMLADQVAAYGRPTTKIYSYDHHPVKDLGDPRITFGYCDVSEPEKHLDAKLFAAMKHPILVIDDASHIGPHVLATLRFVDRFLTAGDYVIVEDGILTHLGWAEQYQGGPLAAIETFLGETAGRYEVDRQRCDTYGTNATWNVDGYLRRVK